MHTSQKLESGPLPPTRNTYGPLSPHNLGDTSAEFGVGYDSEIDCIHWLELGLLDVDTPHWLPYLPPGELPDPMVLELTITKER